MDLNHHPRPYQGRAPPLCYSGAVEPRGIEPRSQGCKPCVFPLDDGPNLTKLCYLTALSNSLVRRRGIEPRIFPASGGRPSVGPAAQQLGVRESNASQEVVNLPQGRFANPHRCPEQELNLLPPACDTGALPDELSRLWSGISCHNPDQPASDAPCPSRCSARRGSCWCSRRGSNPLSRLEGPVT